ncbi:MAG: hypothetical protein PHZ03_06775 [Syntrophomonas sp.]|nr:hypothetical protein [Syntrophomonas sp.]
MKFLDIRQHEDGMLHYFITEQGVDFFLRTKEFPEETKITINLLLFQKQMEKGAFGFAYETVRRLNLEVQKKKDRKYALLEALMYGRLDMGEAYNNYNQSIVMQFEEEAELFNTAVINVKSAFNEYVERINRGEATEREKRTFMLIKIIEKEISRAQTLHTELLKEAAGFTQEYDRALGIRRKAIFTERFNFQGEFAITNIDSEVSATATRLAELNQGLSMANKFFAKYPRDEIDSYKEKLQAAAQEIKGLNKRREDINAQSQSILAERDALYLRLQDHLKLIEECMEKIAKLKEAIQANRALAATRVELAGKRKELVDVQANIDNLAMTAGQLERAYDSNQVQLNQLGIDVYELNKQLEQLSSFMEIETDASIIEAQVEYQALHEAVSGRTIEESRLRTL